MSKTYADAAKTPTIAPIIVFPDVKESKSEMVEKKQKPAAPTIVTTTVAASFAAPSLDSPKQQQQDHVLEQILSRLEKMENSMERLHLQVLNMAAKPMSPMVFSPTSNSTLFTRGIPPAPLVYKDFSFAFLPCKYSKFYGRRTFVERMSYQEYQQRKAVNPQDPSLHGLAKKCHKMNTAIISPAKIKIKDFLSKLDCTNEVWKNTCTPQDIAALQRYLEYSFQRLVEEGGKILAGFENNEPSVMIWNTGLHNVSDETMFCVFTKDTRAKSVWKESDDETDDEDAKSVVSDAFSTVSTISEATNDDSIYIREYNLSAFLTLSSIISTNDHVEFRALMKHVWPNKDFMHVKKAIERKCALIKPLDYFTSVTAKHVIFVSSISVKAFDQLDKEHLVKHKDRFPSHFRALPNQKLLSLIEAAAHSTFKMVAKNPHLAVPHMYKVKGSGESSVQLLLPLYLNVHGTAPDLAMVVRLTTEANSAKEQYEIITILDLESAWINARLVSHVDQAWLRNGYVKFKMVPQQQYTSMQVHNNNHTTAPKQQPYTYYK